MKSALHETALAHWLPYWWVGDDVMVMQDGTMALGYRFRGLSIHTCPDEEINVLAGRLRQFANALPIGFQLQILRHARPVPEEYFREYLGALKSDHPILREQREANAQHLRGLRLRVFDTYLFLSRPRAFGQLGGHQRTFLSRVFDQFSGARDPLALTRERHLQVRTELKQESVALMRFLSAAGLRFTQMADGQLADIAFRFLNQGRMGSAPVLTDAHPPSSLPDAQKHLYRALSLREQLTHSGLSWNVDTLFLEEPAKPYRVLGLKAMPPSTEAALIRKANRLAFEHWLSIGISVPDSEEKYNQVERRRNRAKVAAAGFVTNVRANEQAEELEAAMQAMVSRDQRVFALSLHVLVGANDLTELERRAHQVVDVFREFKTPLATEQMAQLHAFLGMLPGNAHHALHKRTVLTDNAADFLPVYDAWAGDERPSFVVTNRTSEPLALDISSPKRINWNINVFGGSGGGKTFLTLSFVTSTILGQGSPLIVIDVGGKELGSYYRLCKMMGGDFVDLSLDGSNAINPFYSRADLYTDDEGRPAHIPSEQKLSFLVSIAELAVRDPGAPPLSRVGTRILREAIEDTYRRVGSERPPLFSDLADALDKYKADADDEREAKAFAKTLRAFLRGPAGKLLNQQSRVSVRSSFVVFDLKGLENLGDTASVMLLVVSAYVWNLIAKPRKELAWVVYDETWKLMRNESAARLQEELYRTARKLKTGVVAITQSLEDFLASPASRAVLSNTTTTLLLRHEAKDHERVSKLLELNERESQLFSDLKVEKGYYSEFFIKGTEGSGVGRYAPAPFDYWVNTTDGKDRELEREALATHGGNRLAALRHLVQHFPHGAASASPAPKRRASEASRE